MRAVPEPLRVLVIDDEPDIRMLVSMLLRRAGHEVAGEAGDGRHGIEAADQLSPDAIVLDLMMPVMSGREALPELAARCPDTMIVVFSAAAGGPDPDDLLEDGAFACYSKTQMDRLPQLLAIDHRRFTAASGDGALAG